MQYWHRCGLTMSTPNLIYEYCIGAGNHWYQTWIMQYWHRVYQNIQNSKLLNIRYGVGKIRDKPNSIYILAYAGFDQKSSKLKIILHRDGLRKIIQTNLELWLPTRIFDDENSNTKFYIGVCVVKTHVGSYCHMPNPIGFAKKVQKQQNI